MLCPNHLLTLIANHHFTEPFLLAGEGCVLIFVFAHVALSGAKGFIIFSQLHDILHGIHTSQHVDVRLHLHTCDMLRNCWGGGMGLGMG